MFLAKALHIALVQYHSQPVENKTKNTLKETTTAEKEEEKAFQLICGDVPKARVLLLFPGSLLCGAGGCSAVAAQAMGRSGGSWRGWAGSVTELPVASPWN